jgi:hypothetical protein
MICGSIYKIQFPNGKHYIGITTSSLKKRTSDHKCRAKIGDKKCLYSAIRKYNMVDTLELIEIDTADTLDELCEKENGYIIEYNSYYKNGYGYNMTYGGEGVIGYVFTREDKQKMSNAQKKRFENPEEIEKNRIAQKKRFENPEEIKKNREALKKYYQENPEAKIKMSEKMKKYYENNPEAKLKNRETLIKYNEEHPEKGEAHSKQMKQYYKNNPEARNYHGEKIKQYYENNPDARQKISNITKKYYENNPEARQKLSDGKGKNKPFDVFKTDGTFIKTFNYQFEAKEYLQKEYNIISAIKISAVLTGKRNNSAGFVFKYK